MDSCPGSCMVSCLGTPRTRECRTRGKAQTVPPAAPARAPSGGVDACYGLAPSGGASQHPRGRGLENRGEDAARGPAGAPAARPWCRRLRLLPGSASDEPAASQMRGARGGWRSKGQTPRRCLQPGHPVCTAYREPQTTTVLGPKMSPPKVCSVLCVEEEGECRRATPRWPAAAVSRPCPEQTVRSYTRSRSRGAVWGAAGCCPAWESQWVGSEDGAVLAGSRCGGAPTPEHVGVSCCEVRARAGCPPLPARGGDGSVGQAGSEWASRGPGIHVGGTTATSCSSSPFGGSPWFLEARGRCSEGGQPRLSLG